MSPLSPSTLTRLDPRYPLLWRDDQTVQFGLEGKVRVEVAEEWVEPLLRRLLDGIRRGAFDVIAHAAGAPRDAARQLFATLQPVLIDDSRPAPPVWVEGVSLADGRETERMRLALRDEGIGIAERLQPDAVAIVMVGGAASALQMAPFLRDDVPHLPIGFEYDAALIGPLVVPGRTPCLSCRDAHESERDSAWPLLHAQLVGRSVAVSAARISHAAALVALILRTPTPDAGLMVRVTPDGRHSWRSVRHHAECPCRDSSFRSLQESETAPAPLVRRIETTSPQEFALPA